MAVKQGSTEAIVGASLRIAAYVAVFFLTSGFAFGLLQGGAPEVDLHNLFSLSGLSFPLVLIRLGMFSLFLTPFSGIIAAGICFLKTGETRFVTVIMALILVLVIGFVAAR